MKGGGGLPTGTEDLWNPQKQKIDCSDSEVRQMKLRIGNKPHERQTSINGLIELQVNWGTSLT